MLETIEVDIPQITVETHIGGMSHNREYLEDQTYLWSYLTQMKSNFAVRHADINNTLREVFISHKINKEKRETDTYYLLGNEHFNELHLIESICLNLYQYTNELIRVFYFMNELNVHSMFRLPMDKENMLESLLSNLSITEKVKSITPYINDITQIQDSFSNFFVHPYTDSMMLENEPHIFIYESRDVIFSNCKKKSLKELIEQYNAFYYTGKEILKICSPLAIATGLEIG